MFFTYILQSQTTGKLYIGQTEDLQARLERHHRGMSPYTRNKGPWEILYYFTFETRAEALNMEKKLKNFKNPDKVRAFIARHQSIVGQSIQTSGVQNTFQILAPFSFKNPSKRSESFFRLWLGTCG